MQDRIVGPLTMVQFLYAVFGGGFAYICIQTLPYPVNWGLAIIIAVVTFCIIFVKINERPFLTAAASFLTYLINPKVRIWSRLDKPFRVDVYNAKPQVNQGINHKNISKEELKRLANIVDQQ